ncbi:MAG: PAS domain-containing sensor histidine kinase, partial [Bacteroidota bacterium]
MKNDFDLYADPVTLIDNEGKILYSSPSIERLFGYKQDEFKLAKESDYIHPEDFPKYLKQKEKLLKFHGNSFNLEMRLKHKSGHWVWCETIVTNLLEEKNVHAIVSNFRDISVKKLELENILLRENLNALINNSPDLMWIIDANFNFIISNTSFQKVFKRLSGNNIKQGDNMFRFLCEHDDKEKFKSFFDRAFKGESFTELIHYLSPQDAWSEISFNPIKDNSSIIGCACFSHNVTERIKSDIELNVMHQDDIRHTKNLEQFAYIISHNLRSPVAHIIGLTNLLKTNLTKEDRAKSEQSIYKAADNLDQLTKDLNQILQLKSDISEQKKQIFFGKILEEVLEILTFATKKEFLEIDSDFSKLKSIFSIKGYIHSIFHNLISNSIKYRHSKKPLQIKVTSDLKDDKAILSFKDNGIGIDLVKNKEHIFGLYKRFHTEIEG